MNIVSALIYKARTDAMFDQIYPVVIPDGVALPAVRVQQIWGAVDYAHTGPTGLCEARVQFSCFGSTWTEAQQLVEMLQSVLSGFSGDIVLGSDVCHVGSMFLVSDVDMYESETRTYHRALEYAVRYRDGG